MAKQGDKRAPIKSKDDLTDEEKSKLEFVLKEFSRADRLHALLRQRWNLYYGLYRNYRKLGNDLKTASPRDRDTVSQEFVRVFGAELFIPYAFATVETVLPRILSSNPRMLVLPKNSQAEAAIEPVRATFERDQAAINYEMKLQDICRSGLMYGMGWGKTYWEKKYRKGRKFERRLLEDGDQIKEDDRKLVYEGPQVEAPDIFDMFWDPAGKDVDTCGFIIHRTWRTTEYVANMVKCGHWTDVDLESVKSMVGDADRGGIWSDRMEAAGIRSSDQGGSNLHEVLEYHDRSKVYTVLNRAILVQDKQNPHHHGDLPFQLYRPTRVPSEMQGIGEIEPIAHLQFELNTMRSQRRDAATLALNRGYFYQKGMLQPKDMIMGPGAVVPVMGDPREAIYPMPIQDIPSSSVSEEEALKSDIVLTSGISEQVAGTNTPLSSTTATEAQMIQTAASERIKLKAKNLMAETIKTGAAQWRALYIQKVPEKEAEMRIPDTTTPSGYSFVKVSRKDFENTDVIPDAGSIAPENEAEKRSNAIQFTQALAPFIERIKPEKIIEHVLEQYGIRNAESWLQEEQPEQPAGPPQPGQEQPSPDGAPVDQGQMPEQGPPAEQPAPEQPQLDQDGQPDIIQILADALIERGGFPEQEATALLQEAARDATPGDTMALVEEIAKELARGGMSEDQIAQILQPEPQPA